MPLSTIDANRQLRKASPKVAPTDQNRTANSGSPCPLYLLQNSKPSFPHLLLAAEPDLAAVEEMDCPAAVILLQAIRLIDRSLVMPCRHHQFQGKLVTRIEEENQRAVVEVDQVLFLQATADLQAARARELTLASLPANAETTLLSLNSPSLWQLPTQTLFRPKELPTFTCILLHALHLVMMVMHQ